jgi:hypothetical protein
LFKSQETASFDVIDVAAGSWFVKTDVGDVPVDWLKLFCNDCDDEICNPENGTCVRDDSKGSTVNRCVCRKDPENTTQATHRVGLNCELVAQCDFFAPDERTTEKLLTIPGASALVGTEFKDLGIDAGEEYENATMMHHQPIFVEFAQGDENLTAFKMFTGRRWVIFKASQGSEDAIALVEFLEFLHENDAANNPVQTLKKISSTYGSFQPLFFTAPVNHVGESYHRGEAGVTWGMAEKAEEYTILSRRPDDSRQLPVRYLCSDCVSYGLYQLCVCTRLVPVNVSLNM